MECVETILISPPLNHNNRVDIIRARGAKELNVVSIRSSIYGLRYVGDHPKYHRKSF